MKTLDFIERLKAAYNLPSDYAAAKKLGISKQQVSKIRNNGSTLDDKSAFELAHLLDLDPAYVVACMNLERAEKRQDKELVNFWLAYAA
jgi:transcriptional regulator with XRE-family HTH domain